MTDGQKKGETKGQNDRKQASKKAVQKDRKTQGLKEKIQKNRKTERHKKEQRK